VYCQVGIQWYWGLFPGVKVARAWHWPTIPFQGQRWVQLYLYVTSVPPWHVMGQPLPLPLDIGGCGMRANVGRQHQKHLFSVLIWKPEGKRPLGRPLIIRSINLRGYNTQTFCGWSRQVGDSTVGSVVYWHLDAVLISYAYQKAQDFLVLRNVSTQYHINEGINH